MRQALRALRQLNPQNLRRFLQVYKGHVDGVSGRKIAGWVTRRMTQSGHLQVGLFVGKRCLATACADMYRGDVQASGFGDGECGFEIALSPADLALIAAQCRPVTVKILSWPPQTLGQVDVPYIDTLDRIDAKAQRKRLITYLAPIVQGMTPVRTDLGPKSPPALAAHTAVLAQVERPTPNAAPLSAYTDFTRRRLKREQEFDTSLPEDRDHCLYWYITHYGQDRAMRCPLSAEEIAYLNTPISIGGQRGHLPRFMLWRLLDTPSQRAGLDLNNEAWLLQRLFWWVNHEAPKLRVEDCLIPQSQRDQMAAIHHSRKDDAYPLTCFMDLFLAETSALDFLDSERQEDRKTLVLTLMVLALQRPDILQYLPRQTVTYMLASDGSSPSPLSAFLSALFPDSPLDLSTTAYAAQLRARGFDLAARQFLTREASGHRVLSAALPRPDPTAPAVDIQLIGPFEKASGLGQATRLSQQALAQSDFQTNAVNFGLDNPAPEGFSSANALSDYQNAHVNLIHLNAESIPLAYAYAPDVFSGAYNIGYFFWELDSPADCHKLGMDLLDEIWVASAYGVSIYAPHTNRPVVNVGMCFEMPPPLPRSDAREFLQQRCGIGAGEFTFLTVFDSFSFVQRKNPLAVISAFQRAFPSDSNLRLVIKTQNRDNVLDPVQARIWRHIDAAMRGDARITLINETWPYDDLLRLKRAADCYVSLHRSEGWGFGMIEAMNLKVPVICTGYSGNMEFCTTDTAYLAGYRLTPVAEGDYIFTRKGQVWAEPDIEDAARQMRAVYADPVARAQKTAAAWQLVQQEFSAKAIGARYQERLRSILSERQRRVS